jgi:hypothetical protein
VASAAQVIGNTDRPTGLNHQNAHVVVSNCNLPAGLTPKVKTMSGQVKAMLASDADNDGVTARIHLTAG